MPKILSDRIVWDEDDWLGGVVPQARKDTPSTIGSGASHTKDVNPFRQLGSICPGYSPSNVTNAVNITSVIKAGDSDYLRTPPYAYLIGGALVHQLRLDNNTISDAAPWPHTITHGEHASIDGKDLKVYNITNAVTSISSTMALYSFSDNTDGDIGAYDISSGALNVFYDDFLSTQPTGHSVLTTREHPMILGDDGVLYIGDGDTLRALEGSSGSNGTLTTKLTFPPGTIVKSFTKTSSYLIVFTSRSNSWAYKGTSTAYFWNYVSANYNFAYDLSDNIVSAGFNWLGTPGCFTFGRTGDGGFYTTKLKLFNGDKFEQVSEYPSNPPGHGGVEIYDSMIVWVFGSSGSFIGSYGSPWSGRIKGGFNFWATPTGSLIDAGILGVCSSFGGTQLYVSSGTGVTGGLEMFNLTSTFGPAGASDSYFQGIMARPSFPSQIRGKVKSVRIHFKKPATAGRTLALRLYFDGTSIYSLVFTNLGTFTTLIREQIKDSNNEEFPYFHSIWPYFIWDTGTNNTDAPAITKLEVFFDKVKNIQ